MSEWSSWKDGDHLCEESPCCQAKVLGFITTDNKFLQGNCQKCKRPVVQWNPVTNQFRLYE
jgi:hypothetical protein